MAKPKMTPRERKTLELIAKDTDKADIAFKLNETLEKVSELQDLLYYGAIGAEVKETDQEKAEVDLLENFGEIAQSIQQLRARNKKKQYVGYVRPRKQQGGG